MQNQNWSFKQQSVCSTFYPDIHLL